MFRVFNKIRREMIKEGRLARYLGYAVGEIVLIVAGILIALQINEWAQDKQDRLFEQNTLAQIRENLLNDHEALSQIVRDRTRAIASADSILAMRDSGQTDDMKFLLADIIQFDRFNVVSSSYEVLKSRGLDIVGNDDLRLMLGIYYDSLAKEIKDHHKDIEFSFHNVWMPYLHNEIDEFEWGEVAAPNNANELLSDNRFINTLKLEKGNHIGSARHSQRMLTANEELRQLIESELRN